MNNRGRPAFAKPVSTGDPRDRASDWEQERSNTIMAPHNMRDAEYTFDRRNHNVTLLQLKSINLYDGDESERINFRANNANRAFSIKGFDWFASELNLTFGSSDEIQNELRLDDGSLIILKVNRVDHRMWIFKGTVAPHLLIGEIYFHPLVTKLISGTKEVGAAANPEFAKNENASNLIIPVEGGGANLRASFRVRSIDGSRKGERWVIDNLSGDLLLTFKK